MPEWLSVLILGSLLVCLGWAGVQMGRAVALACKVHIDAAEPRPFREVRTRLALVIYILGFAFLAWNRFARIVSFGYFHLGILVVCALYGFYRIKSLRSRLQDEVNRLCEGIATAFATPMTSEDRLAALLSLAIQIPLFADQELVFGVGRDGTPIACVKLVGSGLTDDTSIPDAVLTSAEQKIEILLQEMGRTILYALGEERLPEPDPRSPKEVKAVEIEAVRLLAERQRDQKKELDASAIDWDAVHEAVYRVAVAKVSRGNRPDELSPFENSILAKRPGSNEESSSFM